MTLMPTYPLDTNPIRGEKVQTFARNFIDDSLPLAQGNHHDAVKYKIDNQQLITELNTGSLVNFKDMTQFVGFNGTTENPSSILCIHNGLHVEIQIDKNNLIGQTDAAGVKDVVLESALSTIQDCEDSIVAVDAADKTAVYANWRGLMRGNLAETISKGGKQTTRTLNPDRTYLLDATKKKFVSFGFEGASIKRIAERANIPRANIHYNFANKMEWY
jgi:malate synthase